jgi:hypothetical protein
MKCPSCGSVGELEAFLKAAGSADDAMEDAMPVRETVAANAGAVHSSKAAATSSGTTTANAGSAVGVMESTPKAAAARPSTMGADTGTRISGSASILTLPAGLRCTLTVINGPDSGRKMAIDKPRIVVGRNNGDFPLTDEEVSSQHCAFEISGVSCTVKDLESRNGTFVDGERITSATLSAVGEVQIGVTTILFTMTLDDGISAG